MAQELKKSIYLQGGVIDVIPKHRIKNVRKVSANEWDK